MPISYTIEGSPEHVEVFRDLAAAKQWLDEPG
jgi:hypothetical protein